MKVDVTTPADFLVVGAQKAGTTSFRHYLGQHPQIGLHTAKEAHFFDDAVQFVSGPPDYQAYHKGFPPPQADLKRGEVTPIYMYWEPAMQRIHDYNSAIRLIALLRNPIERAYSHWTMEVNRGAETLSFYDALIAEPLRQKTLSRERRVHFYVERGRYSVQIRRMWQYFDASQVLILRSEDLDADPTNVLQKVCDFLQISTDFYRRIDPVRLHPGRYKGQIDARALDYLHCVFADEINELETLLGWDLSAWRGPLA